MSAPGPCPSCAGPIGDGDRATRGVCALCQVRRRRLSLSAITDQGGPR